MRIVPVTQPASQFNVEACNSCEFVWFDAGEFEGLPAAPPPPLTLEQKLPQPAREKLAELTVQHMEEETAKEAERDGPDEWWLQVAGWLGLPVELDNPVEHIPWLTWILSALIVLVSVGSFFNLSAIVQQFGLIPSQADRLGGLTWLTAFFLHGSVLHLAGNIYFLLVFGDNVEEVLGRWNYLLLLVAADLTGNCLHITLDPNSNLPLIGASGGIAGIITFYALQFPRARLSFMMRWWFRYQWFTMPAYGALILWLLLQAVGVAKQIGGFSEVSALAHLGGAAIGLLFWMMLRCRRPALAPA